MPQAAPRAPRAERTRAAILEAAERLFAERGFPATRLEDVAEAVGIRRASIVYYFRDKRDLYDAVLEAVFSDFRARLAAALGGPGGTGARIEAAVSAWVDYVGERPAFARILLREVADARADARPALLDHLAPLTELVQRFVRESGAEDSHLKPIDPAHAASTIAGATIFFVAAMPTLLRDSGFDPLRPEELEAHRREMLRITRRLLGTSGPRTL
jgi:TetR/AcrR family transcriptional regulator